MTMLKSYKYAFLCLVSLLLVSALTAKNVRAYMPVKGMLLAATEQLVDPRFRGSVILLIQHDAGGTVGLVVNRTSRLPMAKILSNDSKLAQSGKTLSYGGPVEPQILLALVVVRNKPPEPAEEIIDRLFVTGVEALDEWPDFSEEAVDYRAFAGYAGWASGQLDVEMKRGDWSVLPADEQNVLAVDGVKLWERLQKILPEK